MKSALLAVAGTAAPVSLGWAVAEASPRGSEVSSLWERQTLTDEWFGLGGRLAEHGVQLSLGLTQVFQANFAGGASGHGRAGRYAGSYDLEMAIDVAEVLRPAGGQVYLLAEGSWSDGIDATSVGSLFGVNGDAGGSRSTEVTELWYEQPLLDGKLCLRLGKLDLTGGFERRSRPAAFDGNAFANDETSQFLNGALVNNPTIPFPDNGLGLAVHVQLSQRWYVAVGAARVQAGASQAGLRTAASGRNDLYSIFEAGVVPDLPWPGGRLPGAYRIGLWYDPRPKPRFDGRDTKHEDLGLYVSFDQTVLEESADERDTQGLGCSGGTALPTATPTRSIPSWSIGAQYQGLVPGRDDDVLGIGVAQGLLGRAAGFAASDESAVELYGNARITSWLSLTPSLQYVLNPGGERHADGAVVSGIRGQLSF
jgi:porin